MDKKTLSLLAISILILVVMLYYIGIDKVYGALKVAKLEYIVIYFLPNFFVYKIF